MAIAAMTAMDEHRRGGEPVTDQAAEAGAGVRQSQSPKAILQVSNTCFLFVL
jgi:hypothetical protein